MERADTVSATGIAKLAGVGRAAVSNWRRRYPDFPEPTGGTATSPTFALAAVEKWLTGQGKLPERSAEQQLWQAIQTSTDVVERLTMAGVWLLARALRVDAELPGRELAERLAPGDESARAILESGVPAKWSKRHRDFHQAIEALPADTDFGETFEYLHRSYVEWRGGSSAHSTPPLLAQLMVDLAGPANTVLDFTCGTGTILTTFAERGGSRELRCFGQEIDASAARIALLRLMFVRQSAQRSGGSLDAVLRAGDSMQNDAFTDTRVDVVVADPPLGLHGWRHDELAYDPRWTFGGLPPRTEPELAWVQHALAHLEPGGRAVLLMPPAAAARPAGRRIRGELLRRGALQAVIALPAGMLPSTAIALHLWILRNPAPDETPPSSVLFVDSGAATHEAATKLALDAWQRFDADPDGCTAEPGVRRAVPLIDLLDERIDVSPHRQLYVPEQRRDAAELVAARQELDRQLEALHQSLPRFTEANGSPLATARRATLDELVTSGGLVIHRSPARAADVDATESAVTGSDVVTGSGPTGKAPNAGTRIEPADVLIPAVARTVVARVATADQVGARLGQQMHVIRTDPQVLNPWFVAGVLSTQDNIRDAARISSTLAGSMRVNVKRLQVPVLPLEQQQRYGEAFRRLVEFEQSLARVAEQGRDLARELSDALSNGVLDPGSGD